MSGDYLWKLLEGIEIGTKLLGKRIRNAVIGTTKLKGTKKYFYKCESRIFVILNHKKPLVSRESTFQKI